MQHYEELVSITRKHSRTSIHYPQQYVHLSGGMAEWFKHARIVIALCVGSNPIRGKSLFPWALRINFTLIAQYWFVLESDSSVCLSAALSYLHIGNKSKFFINQFVHLRLNIYSIFLAHVTYLYVLNRKRKE
jgi:hypothetical protein